MGQFSLGITRFINNNDIVELVTNENEVGKLCQEINATKSSAIKKISSRILEDAFLCLIPQLTYIFNLLFCTNNISDEWKLTNIF